MTEQQEESLESLKIRLEGSEYRKKAFGHPDGDEFLLRVLRATMASKKKERLFDEKEAYERVCKILDFKDKHNVWRKPDSFDDYRKVYPRFAYKDRKANKVLFFSRMGEFATRGKFSHFTEEEWSQNLGYEMEKAEQAMREISAEEGVETRGYYAISDVKGVGFGVISRKKATVFLANVSGENYPEMLDRVYLVNVPWLFEKVYKIIKPALDPHTVSKFVIHSGIPPEFKDILDLDMLPKEFGGNSDKVVPYPSDSKKYKDDYITYDTEITYDHPA